jgi:hypothetical protein
MPGKRAEGKRFIGGYVPGPIRERFKRVAAGRHRHEVDALIEAMTDYADKHDPETNPEQEKHQ